MKRITFLLRSTVVLYILICFSACSVKVTEDDSIHRMPVSVEQQNGTVIETMPNITSSLSEYSETTPTEPNSFSTFGGVITFELLDKGEYYELYGQVGGTGTYYKIWNEQAEIIDFGFHEKGNWIIQNTNLLEYSISCGTNCRWVKYFDVHNSCVSRFFNNPLDVNDNLVVYTDVVDGNHCCVVQNIFDPNIFYKAIKLNPEPNSAVQFEAIFVDSEHIQVTYPTNNGTVIKTYDIRAEHMGQGDGSVVP